MKKISLIIIIVSLLLIGICATTFILTRDKKYSNNDIIATSKVGDVTYGDVEEYLNNLQQLFGQKIDIRNLKEEDKQIVVNDIINNRIILNNAKKEGIENTEEYKNKLKTYSESLLKEIFLEKIISKNITEETIKQQYNDLTKSLQGKKEYKVKHILVKTKPEIDKVVKELKNNTFEDLAIKYSIDTSKDVGGDLGYVVEGQTVPEFDEVLKKQPLNKMSEPFETQFGWHVLIKEDERKAIIPDYESVKDNIKNKLTINFLNDYNTRNLEGVDIVIVK